MQAHGVVSVRGNSPQEGCIQLHTCEMPKTVLRSQQQVESLSQAILSLTICDKAPGALPRRALFAVGGGVDSS